MLFREREGVTKDGLHWEDKDEIYYMKKILETQNKMLEVLTNIDNKILKYLGSERDKKVNSVTEEINKVIKRGHFKESQREALFELMKLAKEIPD